MIETLEAPIEHKHHSHCESNSQSSHTVQKHIVLLNNQIYKQTVKCSLKIPL